MDGSSNSFIADDRYFIENLDRAISEEWIKAYHQPLLRAASGKVSEEEAFARWEDPEMGMFLATDFVPILDKAHLTYKLDLYMADRVLKKMKGQGEHGLFIVPESVNLSRSDFDSCDIVEEITKIIDASGLPREKLSVELSEQVISSDPQFMQKQVERFHKAGIKVWMDDYGSGSFSLLLLTKIHFDLLKIDQSLVSEIGKNDAVQIILTQLIRTAVALGIDTVAEGVETKEQADFLMEIGCTKLQGFHFIHPISLATIIERNRKGIQIGFENPEEFEYYEQLGKINLYDLSFSKDNDASLDKYFDTMPMAVFALDDRRASFIRCNKSYREFIKSAFTNTLGRMDIDYESVKPGAGFYSFKALRQCARDGKRVIVDDRLEDGRQIQLLVQRIAVNPVTGAKAVIIVVLSVSDAASADALNYNYVARVLSSDYIKLFFVDLDTETFTEYSSNGENRDISVERHGKDFFDPDKAGIDLTFMEEDKPQLLSTFTRVNVEKALDEQGVFSFATRIINNGVPVYINIKAVRINDLGNHIIVGINNIDAQMKTREVLEKAREEKAIYSRLGALNGDYIYLFTVSLENCHYTKHDLLGIVSDMSIADEGDDFREDSLWYPQG